MQEKDYIAVVQCHIVKERCSGYHCEKAFQDRSGGFASYSPEKSLRALHLTCGGCCGLALHRKLSNLTRRLAKTEGISKDRVVVQLSSCITKDNYHGPPCPHLDYLRTLIGKLGLDVMNDTTINKTSEALRQSGKYQA